MKASLNLVSGSFAVYKVFLPPCISGSLRVEDWSHQPASSTMTAICLI